MSIFIFKLVVLLNLVSNFIENVFFFSCLLSLLTGRSKRSQRIGESMNTGAVSFCFYRRNQKVSNHSLPVLQWTQSPLEPGLFLVTKRRETKISWTLANDNKHEIKASQKDIRAKGRGCLSPYFEFMKWTVSPSYTLLMTASRINSIVIDVTH